MSTELRRKAASCTVTTFAPQARKAFNRLVTKIDKRNSSVSANYEK